jgi:hypothetical protein
MCWPELRAMNDHQRIVSGYGQTHSSSSGRPYVPITLPEIRQMVDNPPSVDKAHAQWLIPSSLPTRVFAKQEEHGVFHMLWADLDRNAPSLDTVREFLDSTLGGADNEIYNSRGATWENPKSRILIPVSKPLSGRDWITCQIVLTDALRAAGIEPDMVACRAAQLCFLPNRGEVYDTRSRRIGVYFDPMTTWALSIQAILDQQAAAEAEISRERQFRAERRAALQASDTQSPSLINAFNLAFDVADVLVQAGYQQRGDTFCHPHSSSGSYAASVKNGRVHSLSMTDPLYTGGHSGGAHDAFSAFRVLFHQGDQRAALVDAGNNWLTIGGEPWNAVRQREWAQRQEASLPTVDLSGLINKEVAHG